MAISWVLVACGVNTLVIVGLAGQFTWPVLLFDLGMIIRMLLLCALVALLCFLPAILVSGPVLKMCRWYNGAPLRVGDQVCVLAGKHRGRITTVYDMTTGQGGQPLAKVDLDAECKRTYHDLFDDFALLRTARCERIA